MIKKTRWKAVLLACIFLFAGIAFQFPGAVASAAPAAGAGTADDPYIIDEPSDLVWIGDNYLAVKDKHFKQTADIDMSGVSFTPIGNGTATTDGDAFTGTYDGQGFKIKKLTVTSDLDCVALFQNVGNGWNGTVENVNLEGARFTCTNGSYSYANVAGIAAYLSSGTISCCSVTPDTGGGAVSLTGASTYGYAGGIAASSYGRVYDCFCTVPVSNSNTGGCTGGIVGYACYATAEMKRCYFAGSLGGAATLKGAIVANRYQSTISGNVYLDSSAGYAVGTDSEASGNPSNAGTARVNSTQMKQQATFTAQGWNFTTVWKIAEGSGYPQYITTPGKPSNVSAAFGDGSATVTWDAASRASGYNVYYGTSSGVYGAPVSASGTSTTLTGLVNNQTYYVAVKALHTAEEGPASDEATVVPHKTVSDLAAAPDSGSVGLTFSASGADTVDLQQSMNGTDFSAVMGVALNGASTSAAVTGLTNGTQYYFRLRLVYGTHEYFSNIASAHAGNPNKLLSALTTTGCTFTPAFSSTVCDYAASVGSNVSSITVKATAQSPLSSITINGAAQASGVAKTVALSPGGNAVSVVVTAQNGDAKTYTLTVTRAFPSNALQRVADSWWDTYCGTIMFAGYYTPNVENSALKFDLSGYHDQLLSATLKIYVDNAADGSGSCGEGQFDLYGSADDSWTTGHSPASPETTFLCSVTGSQPDGWKTFDVTSYVQSQYAGDKVASFYFAGRNIGGENDIAFFSPADVNGDKRACIVLVFKSGDASLASISVGGEDLEGFSPGTNSYSYVAPYGTNLSTLSFASVVNDSNASQGGWTYNSSAKTWSVTVTAENGNTQTYAVHVSATPSSDATLKSLKIDGTGLSGFAPGTMNYTYDVPHGSDGSGLTLGSEVNDPGASQDGWYFVTTSGKWRNSVTAEDGKTINVYTVTIHELPSTDATLKSLKIGSAGEMTDLAGFAPGTLDYTYNVPHGSDGSGLALASEVNDPGASQDGWYFVSTSGKWRNSVTAEDGKTINVYTVTIHVLPSTDAALADITIGGTGLPGFSSGTYAYDYNVPHGTDISKLAMADDATDSAAIVGDWSYDAAQKQWSVIVTAEDGHTTKTYTVTFHVLPNTDATLKYIKIDGDAISSFDPGTASYTVDVPYGIKPESVTKDCEASDPAATVGTWSYDSALKQWSVIVTAEDGTTKLTYAVTVHELPNTDATLSIIKVNGTAIDGFASGTLLSTYKVAHRSDGAALTLDSETTDPNASQKWTWDASARSWNDIVTAADGTTKKTYTVKVLSTDSTLSGITVNGSAMPGFSSGTYAYDFDVPYGTNMAALLLAGTASESDATVGHWTYDPAQKKWSVPVTAEDGTTKLTYAVTVHELPNTDATLNYIKINGADVSGFAPGTTGYTVDVPNGTNPASVLKDCKATDPAATVGAWSYDSALKQWSIIVTAEDGHTALTYSVTIHVLPNTDATLSLIKVNGTVIGDFAPGTLSYTFKVAHGSDGSTLTLYSETTDAAATQGAWTWDASVKKWSVTVTAADGHTTKAYTVAISELPSTDATLSGITVNGSALPGFSSGTYSYTYDVPHGTDMATLILAGIANDAGAAVGHWTYDAAQKKWSVAVTAEDGTTKLTYAVTICELPNTDATLKFIKVNGTAITGFAPGTAGYTVDVPCGTNPASVTMCCEAADPKAAVGAWSFDAALKRWSVAVTAEDGHTTKIYTVTIHVLPSSDATLSLIEVNGAAIDGFVPSTLLYTYKVAHSADGAELMLYSETTDAAATQGVWTWDSASKKWSVAVTAADGHTTKTYTVAVVEYSADATLRYIRMGGVSLPGFSPAVTNYTHIVAYGTDVSGIEMSAAATDPNASLSDWAYAASSKRWSVTVTAEDGTTTKTYRVTFVYASTPEPTESPEPTITPEPTETNAAETTPPDETASPTETPTPAPTDTATPGPTASPTAPAPTETNGQEAVTFAVTDGQQPVAGASIAVDGVTRQTGSGGECEFDLAAGAHTYSAAKDGYQSVSGSIGVDGNTGVVCIVLAPEGKVVLHAGPSGGQGGGSNNGNGTNAPVLIADSGALKGGNVQLVVNSIAASGSDTFAVQQQAGDQYDIVGLFDIYLLVDTEKVQPGAPVRVGVPVPEDMEGHDLQIVRINDDGTITRFDTTVQGGMLFFTTDHFSKYAIIDAGAPGSPAFPVWLAALLAFAVVALAALIVILIARRRKEKDRA